MARVTPAIVAVIRRKLRGMLIAMTSKIKVSKLSGQVLHRRSGTLSASIHDQPVTVTTDMISGVVSVGPEAPYGKTHEFGLTVQRSASERVSKLGNRFTVRAHSATYPTRSFMRSTLNEYRAPFVQMVRDATHEAVR